MSLMARFGWFYLIPALGDICYGYPIDPGAMVASSSVGLACLGVVFLILSLLFLIGCACCKQTNSSTTRGFKAEEDKQQRFSNSTTSLHQIGFNSAPPLTNEISIFPPPGVSPPELRQLQRQRNDHEQAARPAGFASAQPQPDLTQWFADPTGHIPRQQIFYQREIGKGWFGKVVEGDARGARVVVRILREDSTQQEKNYFLEEARPYRDLRHRNLLAMHGKSLQQEPYLLLLDLETNGDLKSFLVTNAGSKAILNEQGICLKMMTDIAEGLNYMHENNFIHTDLAARNCVVSSDLTIKIGDYGTSIDKYKDEYYITENVAIPIRWCAPETLHCTPTTIEAKQVTVEANVWSLGVVLWEIAEFGRLPYDELTDDQVIIRVLGSEKLRLSQPDCPYGVFLHNVLGLCWRVSDRAMLSQVLSILYYLRSGPASQADFDVRWSQTKPNTIPRVDNHPLANSREFDSGVDLEMKSCRSMTLSSASDDFLQSKKSASLTNLQGSLDDIKGNDDSAMIEEEVKPQLPSFRLGPLGGRSDSSSDTEEETWRTRIEKGEFTEKVKEKSKSVTDLMVLTHIDSEGSESDSLPSLQPKRNGSKPAYTSIGFGSEGNIRDALLGQDIQSALRQLTATWKPDQQPFLGKVASEMTPKPISVNKSRPLPDPPCPVVDKTVNISSSDLKTETLSGSSQNPNIPEITVTDASIVYTETDVETPNVVLNPDVKPRKLVIVCHDESESSDDEFDDSNSSLEEIDDDPFTSTPCKIESTQSTVKKETVSSNYDELITRFNESVEPDNISIQQANLISSPEKLTESLQQSHNFIHEEQLTLTDKSIVSKFIENGVEPVQQALDVSSHQTESVVNSALADMETTDLINIDKSHSISEIVDELVTVNSAINNIREENDFAKVGVTDEVMKLCTDNDSSLPINSDSNVKIINEEVCQEHITLECEKKDDYESAVILGSCEDYTLDYFKGLKTTYVPPESLSDGSERHDESGDDSDFINDDSQASQVEGVKNLENVRLKPVRQDSNEDPYPDSMSASVTTVSSSSGYATIEKDKIIRNEYNYIEESFSPAKMKTESFDESFPVKTLTESFLNSERDYSSLDLSPDSDYKMSNVSLETPKFLVDDAISQDPFVVESCNYVSYYSDSGECSASQQDEIKELKIKLEDAMKINNDYHSKKSDEEYVGKIVTPDDERSSDSGFRDKGSLSESAEDTCDEKYNLEDIENELDDFTPKSVDEPTTNHEGWFLHPPQNKSGWLSESTEFDVRESVSLNADFINAIRSELRDKLPQASLNLDEDDSSPENEEECIEPEQGVFNLPVQLSPILEERESNQSSLILDDASPANSLDTPSTHKDLDLTYDLIDCKKNELLMDLDNEEDVLVVDTETNQATLIESPKVQTGLVFSSFQPLVDDGGNEEILDNYSIQRESVGFTPDISVGSSSPEHVSGNLSGFFMSPCSVRSDLLDSGPPSLPFDITQSLDEADDLSPALPDIVTSSINNSVDCPLSPDNLKLCSPLDDSSKSFDSTIKNTDTSTETEDNTLVSFNDDTIIRNPESKRFKEYFVYETEKNEEFSPNLKSDEFSEMKLDSKDATPLVEEINPEVFEVKEVLDNDTSADKNGNDNRKEVEKEIDLLLMNNNNKVEVNIEEEEKKEEKIKNDWLEEILGERTSSLEDRGWPSVEELVVKPTCLSSTIALSSPGESGERYPSMPLTPCSEPDSNWRPTMSQLMDMTATDTDEMTTSFIEPGDGTATPEWESDTSESSSSSGEFIWKESDEGKKGRCGKLELVEEEDEATVSDSVSDVTSEEGSEFIPSTWDSSLTPSKSSIRSPSVNKTQVEGTGDSITVKKHVVFKKEKYQCIYEYPREPSDDEQDTRLTWQSPSSNLYNYFDWEVGDTDTREGDDEMLEFDKQTDKSNSDYDFYQLNYNYHPAFHLDEGEFFSKCLGPEEKGSQFFPGELEDVDSGDEFNPMASDVGHGRQSENQWPQERPPADPPQESLGVLRHTKDQLKLDLKPPQTVSVQLVSDKQVLQPVLTEIKRTSVLSSKQTTEPVDETQTLSETSLIPSETSKPIKTELTNTSKELESAEGTECTVSVSLGNENAGSVTLDKLVKPVETEVQKIKLVESEPQPVLIDIRNEANILDLENVSTA